MNYIESVYVVFLWNVTKAFEVLSTIRLTYHYHQQRNEGSSPIFFQRNHFLLNYNKFKKFQATKLNTDYTLSDFSIR